VSGGAVAVLGGQAFTPGEATEVETQSDRIGDRPVPVPSS
jgi:hypothetical protein